MNQVTKLAPPGRSVYPGDLFLRCSIALTLLAAAPVAADEHAVPQPGSAYPNALSSAAKGGNWAALQPPGFEARLSAPVRKAIERYRSDPGARATMKAWLRRAGRYEQALREVLVKEGLPGDLVYVAFVESGLDPVVRSRAAAVGMWQFVERTGAHYGLRIDREVDERRDPILATKSAARFLKELHRKLGSWELAFAAYNMGYYGLTKSIRKFNSNDFWFLATMESGVPNETRHYVARIVATAYVAKNAQAFGLDNVKPLEPWRFEEVRVPPESHLKHVARAAGTSVELLEHLNPAFRKKRTPKDWKGAVRIPHGKSERFMETWSKVRRHGPKHRLHRVRFGETVQHIATHYGVSTQRIRDLNPISLTLPLEPGTRVVVPKNRKRAPVEPTSSPVVVTVPTGHFTYPERVHVFYEITSRDTTRRIATYFEVATEDLARWNNLAPDAPLQSGMVLQLFVAKDFDLRGARVLRDNEVTQLVVGSDAFFAHHEAERGRVRIHYTVRTGDTLTRLAKRFDLKAASIARINRFSRNTTLNAGETIVLYVPKAMAPKGAKVSATPAKRPAS